MGIARIPIVCLCVLMGVALLPLVTTGCGEESSAAEASPTPAPGGTYVVPIEWDPGGVDPASTYDSESAQVNHQVFQGLRWTSSSESLGYDPAPGLTVLEIRGGKVARETLYCSRERMPFR